MIITNDDPEHNFAFVYQTIYAQGVWNVNALLKWTNKEEYMTTTGCGSCGTADEVLRWRYLIVEDILGNAITPFFVNNEYVLEKVLDDADIAAIRNAPLDQYGNHPVNLSLQRTKEAISHFFSRHLVWTDDKSKKTLEQAARDGDLFTPNNPLSAVPPKDTIQYPRK